MDLDDIKYITSPAYPNVYSTDDIDCTWYFSSIQNGSFVVKFIHFWTQAYYDDLIIGTGLDSTDNTSEVYRLHYLFLPNTVSVTYYDMWLRFYAPGGVSKHGFFVQVERMSEKGNKNNKIPKYCYYELSL